MSNESEEKYETGTLVIEDVRLDLMEAFIVIFGEQLDGEEGRPLNEVLQEVLKKAMDEELGAATATRIIRECGNREVYGSGPEPLQEIFPDEKIEPWDMPELSQDMSKLTPLL